MFTRCSGAAGVSEASLAMEYPPRSPADESKYFAVTAEIIAFTKHAPMAF